MPIKKNDLVRLNKRPFYLDGAVLDWNVAIVVRGPYEDTITLSHLGTNPINVLSLVCDVIADGKMFTAIPIDQLSRAQKPLDGAP